MFRKFLVMSKKHLVWLTRCFRITSSASQLPVSVPKKDRTMLIRRKFQPLLIFSVTSIGTLWLLSSISMKDGVEMANTVSGSLTNRWKDCWDKLFDTSNYERQIEVPLVSLPDHFTSEKGSWIDSWTKMTSKISLYSAYLDEKLCKRYPRCVIRVIGIAPRSILWRRKKFRRKNGTFRYSIISPFHLRCSIKTNTSVSRNGTAAYARIIPEHHSAKNSAFFILCQYSKYHNETPTEITIWPKNNSENVKHFPSLKVHHIPSKSLRNSGENDRASIAACVRPLFGPYNNLRQMAEFIAYYSVIGVSHFNFYDYSITSSVRRYLKMLSLNGVSVDLLPWNIPKHLSRSTWEMGQLAYIQDCIYRHSGHYNFVLNIDLDEYIVLKNQTTLQSFVNVVDDPKNPRGSFMFRNVFFFSELCEEADNFTSELTLRLNIQECTMRDTKIWPPLQRSKVMMRPDYIVAGGIHNVWEYRNKRKNFIVNPLNEAVLHHYRTRDAPPKNKKIGAVVNDTDALKFVDDVLKSEPIKILRRFYEQMELI